MSEEVLDSAAVLAMWRREPGWQIVQAKLRGKPALISATNVAEIYTKLQDWSVADADATLRIGLLLGGMEVVPLTEELARAAGQLRNATRSAGLSLGDRACRAVAFNAAFR